MTTSHFHQTPHIIISIAELAASSLQELLVLTRISKVWRLTLDTNNNGSNNNNNDTPLSSSSVFCARLWNVAAALSCAPPQSFLIYYSTGGSNNNNFLPSSSSPASLVTGCCSIFNPIMLSLPEYLIKEYFTAISSSIVITASDKNPRHKIEAMFRFCLATDDVYIFQVDDDDDDRNDIIELVESVGVKYLASSRGALPTTLDLRLKVWNDDKVVEVFDLLLASTPNDQNEEENNCSSKFPCWNTSEIFKVIRESGMDVHLSDDEREDPDVVLFDKMEAFYVTNKNSSTSLKLACLELRKSDGGKKLNLIKFSLEALVEKCRRSKDESNVNAHLFSAM